MKNFIFALLAFSIYGTASVAETDAGKIWHRFVLHDKSWEPKVDLSTLTYFPPRISEARDYAYDNGLIFSSQSLTDVGSTEFFFDKNYGAWFPSNEKAATQFTEIANANPGLKKSYIVFRSLANDPNLISKMGTAVNDITRHVIETGDRYLTGYRTFTIEMKTYVNETNNTTLSNIQIAIRQRNEDPTVETPVLSLPIIEVKNIDAAHLTTDQLEGVILKATRKGLADDYCRGHITDNRIPPICGRVIP